MKKKILFGLSILFLIACEAIFVEDISKSYIMLIAPLNSASIKTGEISFLWEKVSEADNYQLQIVSPSFSNPSQVILDTTILPNKFVHKLNPGDYEWRVKAKNSDYETMFEANTFTVINSEITNSVTELLSPKSEETTNISNQNLTWSVVPGAIDYRVQIYSPDIQGVLIDDVIVTETEYSYDFSEGDFTWQVRPQNDFQNGKYVNRKITVDTEKPNVPENLFPKNNHIQSESSIDFSWGRIDVAGTPEVDSIYVFSDVNLTTLIFKGLGVNKSYNKEGVEKNTYYWFVKAFDKANNESEKSSVFQITLN